ncbi:MAG TPA: hypothetical protein VGF94_04690 [Kofleriaceae bacterium]|jgi:hypothetical protein
MRSIALVAVLACSCTPKQAQSTMKWSQGTLVVGLVGVLATSLAVGGSSGASKDALVGADVTFGLASLGSVVVYLLADANDVDEPANVQQVHQDEAWQATKRARDAAAHGDCDRVKRIAPMVKTLDAGLYEVVFLRDVGIQHCLQAR